MRTITVYCDGGCRGNGSSENIGAWAYTLEAGENRKEDSGVAFNTSNNKMELMAAINALSAIKVRTGVEVNVYTDSVYVMNGITQWIKNWKANGWRTAAKKPVLNKELWIQFDELSSQFSNLNFYKVKGHSGEYGNERVDELCNQEMDNALRN